MKISLEGGKYGAELDESTGAMKFFRNGEPWPGGQEAFQHAKFVAAAVMRIHELEEQIKAVQGLADDAFCHDPMGQEALDMLAAQIRELTK